MSRLDKKSSFSIHIVVRSLHNEVIMASLYLSKSDSLWYLKLNELQIDNSHQEGISFWKPSKTITHSRDNYFIPTSNSLFSVTNNINQLQFNETTVEASTSNKKIHQVPEPSFAGSIYFAIILSFICLLIWKRVRKNPATN